MSTAISLARIEKVLRLATQIEGDINSKQLKPGDRYLDTSAIARMLGCDTTDANRAMQLLVKRKVVERRQRLGTRIAQVGADSTPEQLTKIRVLVFTGSYLDRAVLDSGAIFGLHSALPGVDVQIELVQDGEDAEVEFMHRLVGESLQSSAREGFILLNSSLTLQRLMANSGLPAVIWGHPFPSVVELPYVDRDMEQLGKLITGYALRQKSKRFLLLVSDQPRAGDYILCDTVRDTAHLAGVPANALTVRSVPPDEDIIESVVQSFLEESKVSKQKKGRVAILADKQLVGDIAARVVEEAGLTVQEQVNIVVANYFHTSASSDLSYAVTQPEATFEEQGVAIGKMLSELIEGKKLKLDSFLFNVKMLEPPKG